MLISSFYIFTFWLHVLDLADPASFLAHIKLSQKYSVVLYSGM